MNDHNTCSDAEQQIYNIRRYLKPSHAVFIKSGLFIHKSANEKKVNPGLRNVQCEMSELGLIVNPGKSMRSVKPQITQPWILFIRGSVGPRGNISKALRCVSVFVINNKREFPICCA